MLRTARALGWMRARVFLHGLHARGRSDTLEQLSRALGAILPVLALLLLVPSALALGVAGWFAGLEMAGRSGAYIGSAMVVGRIALLAVTIAAVLVPALRSARGGSGELGRLLLLPVRRSTLHLSEVLAGFTDPWLFLIVPPLLALPLGIAAGGRPAAALTAWTAALLCLATLALLASACAFGCALLFRNRRRGEWISLAAMTAISVAGLLTGTVQWRFHSGVSMPAWFQAAPSELFFDAVDASFGASAPAWALPLLGLGMWTVVLFAVSAAAYDRLLQGGSGAGRRRRRIRHGEWTRVPGLAGRTIAVATATVRGTLRTVRGKIAVFLNCVMVALMYLMFSGRLGGALFLDAPADVGGGVWVLAVGFLFTQLSLLPVQFNLFAVDGAGLALLWLSPLTARQVVRGKLAGCAALAGLSGTLCLLAGAIIAPGASPTTWAAIVVACAASFVVVGPAGCLISTWLPKAADLGRFGRAGNPHAFAGTLGFVVTVLSLLPGLLVVGLALWFGRGGTAALLGTLLWALVAAGLGRLLLGAAERGLEQRRENLLTVAMER